MTIFFVPKNILSHICVMLINLPFTFHYRVYSLIITHIDFDSADPSSMQNTCHIWTRLNDLALHEFS